MNNTKLKELYANLQSNKPATDVSPITSYFLDNDSSAMLTVQRGTNLGNGVYYRAKPNNKYDIYNSNTGEFKTGLDFNTTKNILNTW